MLRLIKTRVALVLVLCLVSTLISSNASQGQTGGQLSGVVKDPRAAVISNAKVTVSNLATGLEKSVETDESGVFLVEGLPAGKYSVFVSKDGFEQFTLDSVTVVAVDPAATPAPTPAAPLDITLNVARVSQAEIDVASGKLESAVKLETKLEKRLRKPILVEPQAVRDWRYVYRPAQYLIVFPYGKDTEVDLTGGKNVKGVDGRAIVRNDEKATFINLELENVPAPRTMGNYNCLVAWAMLDDGKSFNLGQLRLRGNGAELKAATHLKSFRIFVTAEENPQVRQMSGFIVAQMKNKVPRKMLSDIKMDPIGHNIVGASYFDSLYHTGKERFEQPIIVFPPNEKVELEFRGTDYAPDSAGKARLINQGRETAIDLSFEDLPELEPGLNGYVVWAVFSDGQHFRLGSLPKSQAARAALNAKFPFNSFGIMVTAETDLSTQMPSSRYLLVMNTIDRKGISDKIVFLPPRAKLPQREMVVEANHQTGAVGVTLQGDGEVNPESPAGNANRIVAYKWDVNDANKFDLDGKQVKTSLGFGKHTVALKVVDAIGLESVEHLTVTVRDTTAPELRNLPPVIKVEAQTPAGTVVQVPQPLVFDATDSAPKVAINTPAHFPLGETPVTYTAVDRFGNQTSAVVKVQVVDTKPPVIAGLPTTPVIVEAKSGNGTPFTVPMPQVTDNSDARPQVNVVAPPSFALGDTPVKYTAVDAVGNKSEATLIVRLVDTTPPVIAGLPTAPIVAECSGAAGTTVQLPQASASDLVDGSPVVSVNAPTTFKLGDTAVTYTARDAAGNTSQTNLLVRVVDRTPPVFQNAPAAPLVFEATSLNANRVALPTLTATDICGGTTPVTVVSDAPPAFPLGDTRVVFTARDSANNATTTALLVKVVDRTPPQILGLPSAPIVVEGTSPRGATIALPQIKAVDTVDGAPRLASNAPAAFPLGETTVTFTATDSSGNTTNQSLLVRVVDRTPPQIIGLPTQPIIVEGQSPTGTTVSLPALKAVDVVDPNPTLTTDLPASLQLGETPVTITVSDASGNKATGRLVVRVVDTKPPVLSALPTTAIVVPGNGRAGTKVTLPQLTATDNTDAAPQVSLNAPALFPLGETPVIYTARDKAGNQATAKLLVRVVDQQSPVISKPASDLLEVEANGEQGTSVTLPQLTATDDYDEAPKVAAVNAPKLFSVGDTEVNFVATDAAGNQASTKITVRVKDNRAPEIVSVTPAANDKLSGRNAEIKLRTRDIGAGTAQIIVGLDDRNLFSTDRDGFEGVIDTTNFTNGQHQLVITMTDRANNKKIVTIPIMIENPPADVRATNPPQGQN